MEYCQLFYRSHFHYMLQCDQEMLCFCCVYEAHSRFCNEFLKFFLFSLCNICWVFFILLFNQVILCGFISIIALNIGYCQTQKNIFNYPHLHNSYHRKYSEPFLNCIFINGHLTKTLVDIASSFNLKSHFESVESIFHHIIMHSRQSVFVAQIIEEQTS